MKLYYSKGACSLVVRIIINELGLSSDFEAVDLASKKTEKGADFLSINAKGYVPALEIKDHEILTENAVILQYLADHNPKQGLLPPISDFTRYRVLEALNFITTELHKGFSPLFNPLIPQDIKKTVFIPIIKKKFAYLNNSLEKKGPYLFGATMTLPDAYLFVMLLWAKKFIPSLDEYKGIMRFFDELKNRASVKQSLQQEGINL